MGKCTDCLDITTISGTICDHCEKEYCPGCFAMHNMELEKNVVIQNKNESRIQEISKILNGCDICSPSQCCQACDDICAEHEPMATEYYSLIDGDEFNGG